MARITWTQRQDIGPSARFGASLAFDSDRSRTVLFGGQAADDLKGDTWEWDGTHWTQVQDSGPAPRDGAAMAHGDAGTILFGGEVKSAASLVRVGDTWSWDGEDWTQLADTGPAPRIRASLVFDAARSLYVLFGGSGLNTVFGDTWVFDGSEWTQVADTGPSPRVGHAMAYDSARERVVLFGGQDIGLANGETWSWDGTDWTQVQNVGPSGRSGHAMAGTSTAVWLFGGTPDLDADGSGLVDDSWEWDGTDWTQRQDIGPSPRRDAVAAVDSARDRIVLFGGVAANGPPAGATTLVGDTWEARIDAAAPDPGSASFTVDASKAMVAHSDLGYIGVTAAAPSPEDRMIEVTIDGGALFVTPGAIRAGQTSGFAFFALTNVNPGTLSLAVKMGTSTTSATVSAVADSPLRDFTIFPNRFLGNPVRVTVRAPFVPIPQVVRIFSQRTGDKLWDVPVPAATTGTTSLDVVVPVTSAPPGPHPLFAVVDAAGAVSVAGFFTFTV